MTLKEAVATIDKMIEQLPEVERHRVAGAWKTVRRVLGE